ncbi:RNA polymerase sigma factor [Chitinophaga pollutisoli]|uniref:RNA polymerase sigma factor n=1 Tax=Chitinophaga pollutisoli TaxID=3133966 RepID=A0ABZ2YRN2_9BACT
MEELSRHIISNFQQGNERAFSSIIRQLRPHFIRQAYHLVKSETEADEVVSDAFMKLWYKKEDLGAGGTIFKFLQKVVHNNCLTRLEKRGLESKRLAKISGAFSEDTIRIDLQTELVNAELFAEVMLAIEKLPRRKKEVMKLILSDKSEEEIAEQLGITVRTVYNIHYEAKELLRGQFGKEQAVVALILYCISKSNIIS